MTSRSDGAPDIHNESTSVSGWLSAAVNVATGGVFGAVSGVDTLSGGSVSESVASYADAASAAVDEAKEEASAAINAAGDAATSALSSLKWWAVGAVVLVLGVAALVYAPQVKAVSKIAGVG